VINDVCNTAFIYYKANNFEYFLPKPVLENFLSGKAFDNPEAYLEEESTRLKEDINALYKHILIANPIQEKVAVITAGAPGSGKTQLLKQDKNKIETLGKSYTYICPDDVC